MNQGDAGKSGFSNKSAKAENEYDKLPFVSSLPFQQIKSFL